MISPKASAAQLGRNVLIRVNSHNAETGNLNLLCGFTLYSALERSLHGAAAEQFVQAEPVLDPE